MSEYAIETRQLTKVYGTFFALDHVDLHVKKGHIYGLVGDNGAGKSTLLKLLSGQSVPFSGEMAFWGKTEKRELERARRNIGCMIERPGFFGEMTVEQTLKYYCIQKGLPDFKSGEELIHLTGLAEKRKSRCSKLSLGQKQRLGIAIAMLGEPQILILDEPVNGLDPGSIIQIRELIRSLNEEKNVTVLLSSHILSELEQIAHVYGFLSRGRMAEEISAEELHDKCSEYVELRVSDTETYAALLEKRVPGQYRVMQDGMLRIYQPGTDPEIFSRLAAEHDIYITEMRRRRKTLEDYYMEVKERGGKK